MAIAINNNLKNYFWLILLAISLIVILTRCGCNYHLKKVKRKCNQSLLTDTIYRHDTTYIRSVETNTVFHYQQKDTVIIKEGRLTMKYYYNSHDSTVYLNGKCDTIRIIKEVPYMVNTTELKPDLFATYKWWIIGIALILISLLILKK